MNYYESLGVSNTASQDDIKKAYRKLASQHHPDKGGDTKKFQDIQTAYANLEDPQKRAQYDQELAGGGPRQYHFNQGGMPPGMEEIFNSFRQGGFDPFAQFRNQQPQKPRNRDVRITVPVDLASTLSEQEKTLSLTLPGNKAENIEIKIPRGIYHGATIRYPGLGDHSVAGAPRADLYAQFVVRPHSTFEPVGSDLYMSLTVNALEAIVGCEKTISGLDDKEFVITIPPGSQFNTKFGVQNQGLYSTDHPGRGRLVVNLEIYIPKILTKEQLKIISDINATL